MQRVVHAKAKFMQSVSDAEPDDAASNPRGESGGMSGTGGDGTRRSLSATTSPGTQSGNTLPSNEPVNGRALSAALAWGATTLLGAVGLQAAFVHAPARMKLLLLTPWGLAAAIAVVSCYWADWLSVRVSKSSIAVWIAVIVLAGQFVSLELSYHEFLSAQSKRESAGLNPIMLAAIRNAPQNPTTPEEQQGLERMREAISRLDQPVSVRFPRSRFLQWRIHSQCTWSWPFPLLWWIGETVVAMILSATIAFRTFSSPKNRVL